MLEVNPCTRTPVLADISTFAVPLSTYVLIETHIKEVWSTIYYKDAVLWIGFILKLILVEDISVPQNASICFCKTFSKGFKCKKGRIFMNILKFTVLHDNVFYRYILCIMCLSAQ